MEAVKMSGTGQIKSQLRSASAESPKGGDEFMKLLQVKKEQVQPDKTDKKQQSPKTDETSQKDVKDPAKDVEEKAEDQDTAVEENLDQEVLLQAGMQQTLAQMAGVVTQQPVEEGVHPTEETAAVAVAVQAPAADKNQVESFTEPAAESQVQQPEPIATEPVHQQKEADSSDRQATENHSFTETASEKTLEKEPEVRTYGGQTETRVRQDSRTEEKTDNHENVHDTAAAQTAGVTESRQNAEPEHDVRTGQAEEIPLKTTQADLPKDLGRTLADRFPGTGRELIVELEPANLGKLTIKMVYEAGRAAVSIMATNPRTLEILNQRAAEIASILEEKTGQETIIYTQEPQQENQEENPDQNHGGREGQRQEEKHQAKDNSQHEAESFAQQLRLGLV